MRPADVSAKLEEVHLLDVREPDEWEAGHIPGSQHIPMRELRARIDELPRDRKIVAVCRHGNRSEAVTRGLQGLGFDCENLEGGVTDWRRAGLPLEADDGGPGTVI
ncbi:MAG TPA: rhodanese-like domain-containing protein [Candidatus Limnocylindria bacterium]